MKDWNEFRDALKAGAGVDEPSDEVGERIEERVMQRLAHASSHPPAAGAKISLTGKALVVLFTVVTGGLFASRYPPRATPAAPAATSARATLAASMSAPSPPIAVAPRVIPPPAEPSPRVAGATSPVDSARPAARAASAQAAGRAANRARPPAEREIDYLRRAVEAQSDGARALGVVEQYRAHYPRGQYAEGMDRIEIRAYRGLRDEAAARRCEEAFRRRYPNSALVRQGAVEAPR